MERPSAPAFPPSLTVCTRVALLLLLLLQQLLAFVTGSNDLGGQHWPAAPVELDSRDDAIRCAWCLALCGVYADRMAAATTRTAQPSRA
jgi:hypothetical protein